MEINYENYPAILYTSFQKNDAPPELSIAVLSEYDRDRLSRRKGFTELFAFIGAKNSIEKKNCNTYLYLEDDIFHKIDSNDYFRQRYFSSFFVNYSKPKNGVILFKDGGQYVYLLLGKQQTKQIKGQDGRYIAVAFLVGNNFVGFEEGIIKDKGIQVEDTGIYNGGMDRGGYICFVLVTMAYADGTTPQLLNTKLSEEIYLLK